VIGFAAGIPRADPSCIMTMMRKLALALLAIVALVGLPSCCLVMEDPTSAADWSDVPVC